MQSPKTKILGYLQVFVGMGAVAGGLPMILNPGGSDQGLTTEVLANSPFPDYLIPGIFLFVVNGLGSLFGAYLSLKDKALASRAGMVLGIILILWIVIQVYYLGLVSWLQPFFFIIGIAELVLGIFIFKKEKPRLG
ncbi:MAG TPA: hypothetical protein PLK12_15370 [Prolixibacteraceae bacterium]|nr:hypothetical protein [Prolixibacteraceae bacterium]